MSNPQVAIVTAGGGGIGAAVSRCLSQAGYQLVIMSRSEACESLAQELNGLAVRGSVTEAEDLKRVVDETMARYGRIDAVVNHTAHPPKGELLEIDDDAWHLGLDMLIMNVVRMTRLVTPIMQSQGDGAWVNISTFAAFEPELKLPISCTLRAGLSVFSKLYADRYADSGIRMNNVLPGYIDSLNHAPETAARIPLGRIGSVEEIAETTRFLLSKEAGYITGQSLIVDGGLTRHV